MSWPLDGRIASVCMTYFNHGKVFIISLRIVHAWACKDQVSHCFVKAPQFQSEVKHILCSFPGLQKEPSCISQDSLTTQISEELSKIPQGDLELFTACSHLVYSDNQESDDQETSEPPTPVQKANFFQLVGNKFKALGERSRRPRSIDSQSSDSLSLCTSSNSGTHDTPGSRGAKTRKFQLFRRWKNTQETSCMECELACKSGQIKISSKQISQNEYQPTVGDFHFRSGVDDDDDEYIFVDHAPLEFSLNIPYESVQKGNIIGQGAFGEVYEGQWYGRRVAMKVVAGHHYTCPTGTAFIDSLKKELTVLKVNPLLLTCWISQAMLCSKID